MANLFLKQAKQYSKTRPGYPQQLFDFISSKTPTHDVVWDVGTGSGQAVIPLATTYKNVIATDTSSTQLDLAPKLPNVRYEHTPSTIPISDLTQLIGPESSLDLVTVAQALHWFAHDTFYSQVKHLLKKPHGVIAAWCYTTPQIDSQFDPVFQKFYTESSPFWDSKRGLVDGRYVGIEFPFEAVRGCEGTGPFEFRSTKVMSLGGFCTYVRSWSAYQTAKEKGVELLSDGVVREFERAWNGDGNGEKSVTFPVYLRIGKVGDSDN